MMIRNVLGLSIFNVFDKIFPISVIFFAKNFLDPEAYDRIGFIIISLNSIISWSNSGLSVSITKAAALSDDKRIEQIISINIISTLIVTILFFFIQGNNIFTENVLFILTLIIAGSATLFKSIRIAKYQWKVLITTQLLATIVSLAIYIINAKYGPISESMFFVYYLIPLLLLFHRPRLHSFRAIKKLFGLEILPLFITGACSSLFYIFLMKKISHVESDGILGDFALSLQVISIIQFLPIILNKISFIDLVRGESISKFNDIILRLVIIGLGVIGFVLIGGYLSLDDLLAYWLEIFVVCSLGVLSIYYGNMLVAKGDEWVWTRISVISTASVLVYVSFLTIVNLSQILVLLIILYFLQMISGYYYVKRRSFIRIQ